MVPWRELFWRLLFHICSGPRRAPPSCLIPWALWTIYQPGVYLYILLGYIFIISIISYKLPFITISNSFEDNLRLNFLYTLLKMKSVPLGSLGGICFISCFSLRQNLVLELRVRPTASFPLNGLQL